MSTDEQHFPQHIADDQDGSRGREPLSAALKRSTREAHRRAETTGVIRRIIRRQATREIYATYLRNLHPVYASLEAGLERLRTRAGFEVVAEPGLARRTALESDLAALAGDRWETRLEVLPAAEIYAREISAASTSQLVAHAYVRYLGDLNGGLVIKRLLQDSMALVESELGFYDFPAIGEAAAFRERFKESLDGLAPGLDRDSVIAGALRAFELATDLSIEIEQGLLEDSFGERSDPRQAAGGI